MKQPLHTRQTARKLLCLALSVSLALPVPAFSASLSLATEPLAKSTTTDVLPNLMFIMDSSGSMGWNYLPDWANDSICKNTDGNYTKACADQPLFRSPDFNGIYYNPAIRYESAVDANGTSKGSQTTWTSVKNDAYGIQSTASTDLVKGYSDTEWCTDQKDSNGKYVDCLRNDNYLLPGVVGTKTYKNERAAVGTGSGSVATGSPAAPATATRSFGPHYYRINPGEFCDSAKLTNCQPTENSTFSFPARLRWCTTDANAKAAQPSANSCQAIRFGSFVYARFPTKFFTAGTPAVSEKPAVPASATFDLSMNGCNNSKKAGISKVLVGATNILPSATSDEKDAASLADRVRSKIATNGYTFSGSGTLIKITAPVGAGNTTSPVTLERTSSSNGSCVISPMNRNLGGFTAAVPAVPEVPPSYYGSLQRIDIVSGSTYPRSPGRTDCKTNTASCTYEEEMTNFANWWTYYHTRMQAMKTSVSLAFKPIDSAYRIGFIDIQGNNYLPIDKFELGTGKPKNVWYNKLFSMNPLNGTPLRSALAR
ncbi:MAG TPA: hypothetical protein VGP12_00485, partial [Nitrosospira sp.]|nr:hypothetical protein [Nitrosospira sp.]